MATMQLDLLSSGTADLPDPFIPPERFDLGHGAWIDYSPNWLPGADDWFLQMRDNGDWKTAPVPMYGKMVDTPRLVWWSDEPEKRVAGLADLRHWFEDHYCRRIKSVSASWYRDGRDSVAMHRDKFAKPDDTIVAIVALGARRPLVIKPDDGNPTKRFPLGHGDLFVMGGSFQATHQHGVPKQAVAEPRISIMFRT